MTASPLSGDRGGQGCDCRLGAHNLHRLGCPKRDRPELYFDYPQDARKTDPPDAPYLADPQLRDALAVWNWDRPGTPDPLSYEMADEILALPAVQRLIAEHDEARAQVQRVRQVANHFETLIWAKPGHVSGAIRRALDGNA